VKTPLGDASQARYRLVLRRTMLFGELMPELVATVMISARRAGHGVGQRRFPGT
jgi:hypothetical protein